MSTRHEDEIALAVLRTYAKLPQKFKPTKDGLGISNWVPLAGIVLEGQDRTLQCVSLATGMKCLPATKIPQAHGRILHDSHAEILALRTFNHFLLQECIKLKKDPDADSTCLVRSGSESMAGLPYEIRPGVKIHMYCSDAPCGDASMELIMQKQEDATPWTSALPEVGLLGRGHFDQLGQVRRKPARADSPETLSKSCSDKLALRQCTSLLCSQTLLFISPQNAYLSSLIVPETQYTQAGFTRCFYNRMIPVCGISWPGGFAYKQFDVSTTSREFEFSRRMIEGAPKPSSLACILNPYVQEIIINGVVQGRKQTDDNCGSAISRLKLSLLARSIDDTDYTSIGTYKGFKLRHRQLKNYAKVKDVVIHNALRVWVPNVEDDFELQPA